jgi:phytoene synthase
MNSTSATSSPPASTYPRQGSSLYYALGLVPCAQRPSLAAWLTWWHDTARIPLDIADPGVAETKLRWWQQALAEAAQGQAQHPLLQQLLAPGALRPPAQLPPWPCWLAQLDALIALIHQNRWLDHASLQVHIQATTGLACEGAAFLLGAHSEAACSAARQLGCGLRQAHQLARLGQDARAGWVHVPIDVLQQHGVRAHQLSKPEAGQAPDGWRALLTTLSQQAMGSLRQGLDAWQALPTAQRQALRPLAALAHMHLHLVKQIASQGDAVLHQRIVLTPLRKWWICQKVRWGWLT